MLLNWLTPVDEDLPQHGSGVSRLLRGIAGTEKLVGEEEGIQQCRVLGEVPDGFE